MPRAIPSHFPGKGSSQIVEKVKEETRVLRAKVPWTKKQIELEKLAVRSELEQVLQAGGPKRRLQYILTQVRDLKESDSPGEQLRCFIFVISALVHQERFGGVPLKQVQRLVTIAYALLQIQGIEPITSLLAFLYGEIHLALSQVYRKEGLHWMAAWEQQMASYLSGKTADAMASIQKLSLGIRTLRLGHGGLAVKAMLDAKAGLPDYSWFRCQIDLIRSLRFAGSRELARQGIEEGLKRPGLKGEEKQELLWEHLCLQVSQTQEVFPLMHAVRKDRTHHDYSYLTEAFLWSRAISTKKWVERYPSLRSLARDPKLTAPTRTLFYKCALMIQKCYDYEIPFPVRLRQLGRVLPKLQKLVTIDQELLVWAAVARWLTRSRCFPLASLALSEYQSLSRRLSNGASEDALGVMSDLYTREWFTESQVGFPLTSLVPPSKKEAA